jgi:DNA-binding NtrC family response regulator
MDKKTGKILAIDDNRDILLSLKLLLKSHVASINIESNPKHIPELLKNEDYDVILLDMNFSKAVSSGEEGYYWLNVILNADPQAVVIFITAYGDVEKAVRAIKAGATDFVLKPWDNNKLLSTIHSAIQLRKARIEANQFRQKQKELGMNLDQPFHDMIGQSPQMKRIFETIKKVAKTDASVLILGENGTGKELVARALHRNSNHAEDIFLPVDLGSISESLFESELFGHMKGAFTDARENRAGRFEVASGGTLFLDEIGNLPLALQGKLLSAIERGEINRLGASKPIPIDVRYIFATNMPLYQMAEENTFRKDLLYRINTVEIQLPALRERREDIPLLSDHFLKVFSKKYNKKLTGFTPDAQNKLKLYPWPGNVRELQHAIERAVILSDQGILAPDDLMLSKDESKTMLTETGLYDLEDMEKRTILKVLRLNNGNVTKAAKEMGITRASLYRRIEKYGL